MSNYDVEKTIVVPDSNSGGCGTNFLAGMLASACQSKGLEGNEGYDGQSLRAIGKPSQEKLNL